MTRLIPHINLPLIVVGFLWPLGVWAQTALPIRQNLPFSFAGRSVPQLLNGANGFRFNLPENTVYAAVKLQTITPGANVHLLVRRGEDLGGTANEPVFGDRDTSDNPNKRVQIGFDSRLPIGADQPYFVALRAPESSAPIAGVIRLEVETMTPGGTRVQFSGIQEIMLAGQPDGTSFNNANAPLNSPPEPVIISAGQGVRFQAIGNSTESQNGGTTGPEGEGYTESSAGNDFAISAVGVPAGGLLGVFLGPSIDTGLGGQILPLNFHSDIKNLPVLKPRIQQLFFIGSGLIGDGRTKTFVVPPGATRLYVGRANTSPTGSGRTTVRVELLPSTALAVPTSANPIRLSAATHIYLAGQPDNTQSSSNASAPTHTPPQIAINLVPGQALVFRASGSASEGCAGIRKRPRWFLCPRLLLGGQLWSFRLLDQDGRSHRRLRGSSHFT